MFFLFPLRTPLFDEAGTGEPEGQAGGNGEHAEGGAEGQGQPQQPAGVTIDALKDLLKAERESTIKEVTKQLNGIDAKFKRELEKQQQAAKPKESNAMTPEQLIAEKEREFNQRFEAIQAERAAERAAMQKEKLHSQIKSSLADFQWQTDAKGKSVGREIAQDFYAKQAEFDEDGTPKIAGMPLEAYIREHAATAFKPYHASRPIGGAGAGSGNGKLTPTFSMQDLQRKAQSGERLTDDEKKAAREELARFARGGM